MSPPGAEAMEPLPELYAIFQGEVAAVTEYGAFIKIPGCRKQGLVHKTHMSSCRIDKPSEVVDVGDKVWVKLIGKEMKDDKLKLSLSMKVVNQGTGKDLDPNNVSLDQDERKKRTFRDYTSQKITLEAVLNTVCKKCGCKGMFLWRCFVLSTQLCSNQIVTCGWNCSDVCLTAFCFVRAKFCFEENNVIHQLLCRVKT